MPVLPFDHDQLVHAADVQLLTDYLGSLPPEVQTSGYNAFINALAQQLDRDLLQRSGENQREILTLVVQKEHVAALDKAAKDLQRSTEAWARDAAPRVRDLAGRLRSILPSEA